MARLGGHRGGYARQRQHMAGSSQPQHFFAAECIFTDFEAMITDTVSTRTSAGLMAISI